jgi:hypothetical protein
MLTLRTHTPRAARRRCGARDADGGAGIYIYREREREREREPVVKQEKHRRSRYRE